MCSGFVYGHQVNIYFYSITSHLKLQKLYSVKLLQNKYI